MVDEPAQEKLREWLATRPPKVQALAEEFPHGHRIDTDDGVTFYVIGWTEDDMLVVSRHKPEEMFASHAAFEEAMASREYICADHLREESKDA